MSGNQVCERTEQRDDCRHCRSGKEERTDPPDDSHGKTLRPYQTSGSGFPITSDLIAALRQPDKP
jgi:hypothetical protein